MTKRILVVDDSAMIRQMVSFTLCEAGYEVSQAENGEQGVHRIREQAPDLIITDLNMPIMDGVALIRNARALPSTRFIPILMLTTESQEHKKMEAKAAGATGWLVKPFDPPKLLSVISKVLG